MNQPLPFPDGRALARNTDLYIKSLAYATDAKLAAAPQMFTSIGSSTTDVNGELVVDFHTAKTITGCIVLTQGVSIQWPALRRAPGASTDNMSQRPIFFIPRLFLTGGLVWVKGIYGPFRNGSDYHYGAQPVAAGSNIKYMAFGWSA